VDKLAQKYIGNFRNSGFTPFIFEKCVALDFQKSRRAA